MGIPEEIIKCASPGLPGDLDLTLALSPFKKIMLNFFGKAIPKLITTLPVDINFDLTKLPGAIFDIVLDGVDVPPFSLKIKLGEIEFEKSFSSPNVPSIEGFDPSGMIKLLTAIIDIAFQIPQLFFDFDKKTPKTPDLSGLGFKLGLPDFSGVKGFEKFATQFPICVTTSLLEALKK